MAGIEGVKTNHSLHVSGASSLFDAGVPERIIQACTGHRCLESLQLYERVTEKQDMKVSKILSGQSDNFAEDNEDTGACSSTSAATDVETGTAAQLYNNCTVNMYMPGNLQYFPSPYPYSMYPAYYPPFPPLPPRPATDFSLPPGPATYFSLPPGPATDFSN